MPSGIGPYNDPHSLWAQLQAEFDRYHAAISFIPTSQTKLQDDLRRYLCLRCAGFLERLTYVCVIWYLEECSGGPAQEFAKSFFSSSPNITAESLKKLIGRFGGDHSDRFEIFLTKTRRDSLNDLSSVRNPIAHGQVPKGQKLDPEKYRLLCKDIFDWMTNELRSEVVMV